MKKLFIAALIAVIAGGAAVAVVPVVKQNNFAQCMIDMGAPEDMRGALMRSDERLQDLGLSGSRLDAVEAMTGSNMAARHCIEKAI